MQVRIVFMRRRVEILNWSTSCYNVHTQIIKTSNYPRNNCQDINYVCCNYTPIAVPRSSLGIELAYTLHICISTWKPIKICLLIFSTCNNRDLSILCCLLSRAISSEEPIERFDRTTMHRCKAWKAVTGYTFNLLTAGAVYICFLHFLLAHYISAFKHIKDKKWQ